MGAPPRNRHKISAVTVQRPTVLRGTGKLFLLFLVFLILIQQILQGAQRIIVFGFVGLARRRRVLVLVFLILVQQTL